MIPELLLLASLGLAPPVERFCSVRLVSEPDGPGLPITGPLITPAELVRGTPAIVRASALRPGPVSAGDRPTMLFRVTEVLKGQDMPDSLIILGHPDERDQYNPGPVPYARGRDGRGSCHAYNYRIGAEYLLFLHPVPAGWTPYHSIFSPTNEQLRGPDDPWLLWVRERLQPGHAVRPATGP
jgi:hypothetical protein